MKHTFTCPDCGHVSHNPHDYVEGWCSECFAFTGPAHPAAMVVRGKIRQVKTTTWTGGHL